MGQERMKKSGNLILCVMFVLLCIGAPLAGAVMGGQKGSEEGTKGQENRVLAEFPKIEDLSDLWAFPTEFEDWFSDHLFFKSSLVSLKSKLEAGIFGELDSEKVILGTRKPWLFHRSEDGQPLETYKKINLFSQEELEEIAENLGNLQWELQDAGIGFILMISPDKEQIYGSDYMPETIRVLPGESRTEQLLAYLSEALPELAVVYPKKELEGAKGQMEGVDSLYYESDTHWNKAGAWVAAEALLKEIGSQSGNAYAGADMTFHPEGTVQGDLQRMAQLGADYNSREYEAASHREVNVLREFRDQNDEVVLETTECGDEDCLPVSVYLSGDSFRWNLGPYIKENAARVTISSRYYFSTDDLAEQEPQVFVYMIAERYLHELSILPGYNTMALQIPE